MKMWDDIYGVNFFVWLKSTDKLSSYEAMLDVSNDYYNPNRISAQEELDVLMCKFRLLQQKKERRDKLDAINETIR